MQPAVHSVPRRRETRRHDRRESILDEATRSFMRDGYAATTMSAIAARLGGSKGTLWNYFPSKELLFTAVLERETVIFQVRASQLLQPDASVGANLLPFAREFITRVTGPDAVALHQLVIGESRRFPEIGVIFHQRVVGRTRDILGNYFAGAMARGLLRSDDASAASRLLLGLCLAGIHQQLLLGLLPAATPELVDRDAELAVSTFLRAYEVPAAIHP